MSQVNSTASHGLGLLAWLKYQVFSLEAPFFLAGVAQFKFTNFVIELVALQSVSLFVVQLIESSFESLGGIVIHQLMVVVCSGSKFTI